MANGRRALVGICVRVTFANPKISRARWGIIEAVEASGMAVLISVGVGKRARVWRRVQDLEARTAFGKAAIALWVADRTSRETLAIEFAEGPTIPIEAESGRRRIKGEDL